MNKLVNFFGFIVITTTAILTINYFIFGLSKKQTYPNKNEFIQNRIENGNPHVNSFEAILTESLIPNCANNIIYINIIWIIIAINYHLFVIVNLMFKHI